MDFVPELPIDHRQWGWCLSRQWQVHFAHLWGVAFGAALGFSFVLSPTDKAIKCAMGQLCFLVKLLEDFCAWQSVCVNTALV